MVNSRITAENVGKNNAMKVGQRKKVSDSVQKEQTQRRNFVISCNLLRCDAARRGLQDPHTWGCTGLVTEFSAAVELSLSSSCTTCNEVIKHRWCKLKLMQHILLRAPEYRFHHRVVRYPVGFEVWVDFCCFDLCYLVLTRLTLTLSKSSQGLAVLDLLLAKWRPAVDQQAKLILFGKQNPSKSFENWERVES